MEASASTRQVRKLTLWTVQSAGAWAKLKQDGALRADARRILRYYRGAYDWMSQEMERRLGYRPSKGALPLWAWYQWNGATCRRPDLRCSGHVPRDERCVRIEFDISERFVLLSDFDLWHYVLNYWYLPKSLKDGEALDAELTRHGLSYHKTKPLPDQAYHGRITESWKRIFDIDWADRTMAIARPRAEKAIQASLWVLRRDQVKDVRFFRAR